MQRNSIPIRVTKPMPAGLSREAVLAQARIVSLQHPARRHQLLEGTQVIWDSHPPS